MKCYVINHQTDTQIRWVILAECSKCHFLILQFHREYKQTLPSSVGVGLIGGKGCT